MPLRIGALPSESMSLRTPPSARLTGAGSLAPPMGAPLHGARRPPLVQSEAAGTVLIHGVGHNFSPGPEMYQNGLCRLRVVTGS
jgi:hypothetical protein